MKYYILAAAALTLAACNNNDDNNVDQPVAAQISASIGSGVVSRASDEKWAPADAIGVTMDDRYVNYKYTTEAADGVFKGTTMYFKNKRDEVTLTAYYPYTGDEGTTPAAIEISTPAERQTSEGQTHFDFLFAKLENVTGRTPNVEFAFSHKMSKITLIFKNGNEGTDVRKITSYQIEGLVLDVTFDTATGVCVAKDADPATLSMTTVGVESGESLPSLILFPQSTADKTVTLKLSDSEGQDYACSLSFEDDNIKSGNNYQFTISVNKTGLTVNQSTITDWNTIDSQTGAESDWKN